MALVARQAVSVGTTAVRLDADATDRGAGSSILIVSQGTGTLCLGPADVTSSTGARVPCVAGTTVTADLSGGEPVYGVVSTGTLAVDVLLTGA